MDFLFIGGGLVALYFGAEWLLKGAVSMSRKLGLPTLLVSLVIVGFGTSFPELLVSLRAALTGSSDIAIGNVVGSNTANIMLILGISALIYPISGWDKGVRRDALVMLGAAVLTLFLVQFSVIGRIAGLVMLLLLSAYLAYAYFEERTARKGRDGDSTESVEPEAAGIDAEELSWPRTAAMIAIGLVSLFAGAELLIRGATALARDFGISEAVIGLTVVAVGTSLPELATGVIAAMRRHSDVMIGNVVGSNIFNILCILGITALVLPVPIAPQFAQFDVPVMLAVTVVFAAALFLGKPIGRLAGGVLVAGYAAYTAALL